MTKLLKLRDSFLSIEKIRAKFAQKGLLSMLVKIPIYAERISVRYSVIQFLYSTFPLSDQGNENYFHGSKKLVLLLC
jgi:hypothetical protein